MKAKRVKKVAVAAPIPRPPRPPVSVAAAAAASSLAPQGRQLSAGTELFLGFALGLLLISVAVALAPPAVLPGAVFVLLDRHRDVVISLVSAIVLGVAAGLLVFALS